jgi:hypothetical protein
VLTAIGLNASNVQQWKLEVIAYDANGNVTSRIAFDSAFTSNVPSATDIATWMATAPASGDVTSYMFYDKANRLTSSATLLRYNSAASANEWAVTTLVYDNNGNVVLRRSYATPMVLSTSFLPTTARISTFTSTLAYLNAADVQTSMVYDSANRLIATASAQTTALTGTGTSRWSIATQSYDADGNVVQRRSYATTLQLTGNGKAPSAADIAAFTAAPANSSPADQQVYFGYDHANRLISANMTATAIWSG